jgi:ribosomal protein S18 acetylase RimI-like enzyme
MTADGSSPDGVGGPNPEATGAVKAGPETDGLRIERLDPVDVELVAPLWGQLLDHIATLPDAIVPIRPFEQSWPLEHAEMLEELAGQGFVLAARRGAELVGYAYVKICSADPVWYTGEHCAELAHLCVAAGHRSGQIGSRLLDAVDEELQRRGINDVQIGVDAANHDALRFYERRGYRADFHILYGSPAGKPLACLEREAADREAHRGRFADRPRG